MARLLADSKVAEVVEFRDADAKLTPTASPSGMLWTVIAIMRRRMRLQLAKMLEELMLESRERITSTLKEGEGMGVGIV